MIHDGNGDPVGQRPGFLFSDNEADDQARRGCLSGIRRRALASVGVRGRGSGRARRDPNRRRRSTTRKRLALPPMRNITGTLGALAQMTDYQSLPPSVLAKIEDPSVNTVASRKSILTLASRLHLPMARSRMTWPP